MLLALFVKKNVIIKQNILISNKYRKRWKIERDLKA